jgi:hypothetical protein
MNLNLALGRGHLLRPFLAVLAVFLGQIVVVIWSQLPALGDQGPSIPCLGKYYGSSCHTALGGWSFLMYAPELGVATGLAISIALRQPAGRWILGLGAAGIAACTVALIATHGGAAWQMPIP